MAPAQPSAHAHRSELFLFGLGVRTPGLREELHCGRASLTMGSMKVTPERGMTHLGLGIGPALLGVIEDR